MLGDNGIIKKAQQAKEMQANSTVAEQEDMDRLADEYANLIYEPPQPPEITADTPAGTEVKMPNTWTSTEVKAISDGAGTEIPLPNGFYYVGGDYNSGLVISDKQGDTMDASGTSMGNQYVWIPVESDTSFVRENLSNESNWEYYTEPHSYDGATGYEGEETEYTTMRSQVVKYGGFYVGRYEAGIESTELRAEGDGVQEVVVKKGVAPYNWVPWGTSMTEIGTEGAAYLAQNMYTTGELQAESVTSTLIYGVQWDAMCRYIGEDEYTATTPTKTEPELTGSVSTDEAKNIYDLAGNCREWTMEAGYGFNQDNSGHGRVERGGNYYYEVSVANRYPLPADYNVNDHLTFRVAIYIK